MPNPDLAFYNVGTEPGGGFRTLVVAPRRLLRRLLRPFLYRLVEILQSLCDRLDAEEQASRSLRVEMGELSARQDELTESLRTSITLGWDHVALARRLATLEDRVELLTRLVEADLPEPDEEVPMESPRLAEHGPHFHLG